MMFVIVVNCNVCESCNVCVCKEGVSEEMKSNVDDAVLRRRMIILQKVEWKLGRRKDI